jgi:hypothetical protein
MKHFFLLFAVVALVISVGVGQTDKFNARDEANVPAGTTVSLVQPTGDGSQSHIVSPLALLFDNGPLVTHPGGGFGGADASVLQNTVLNTYGYNVNAGASFRIADDFTVAGGAWIVDSIAFFGYQTGSTTTSTITAVRLQIWDGPPGEAGSTVIFGDITTNRMVATRFSGIYRAIATNLVASDRPIMRNIVNVGGLLLLPGTYWLDWTMTGSLTSGPWQPPVTILGQYVTGNGRQFTGTAWQAMRDSVAPAAGNPQGAPFIIYGTASSNPLNPFALQTPAAGATITTLPGSTTPVSITWDTSTATATYKWIFGVPVVPPRLVTLSASTNSINTTLGALDVLLAGLGVQQGDSLTGQWDVWAFRNNPPANDSLKSSNGPRAIKLKRGRPALTAFSLVSPPTGTTVVTSAASSSPINVVWRKSGDGATYRWKFATPTFAGTIRLNISAGLDTSATFRTSQLDSLIAGLGVAVGDSIVGQWRAFAYSGTDSLASTQTFNVTFKRVAVPCLTDFSVTRATGITYTSISSTGNSFASWRNTTSIDDNRSAATPIGFTFKYIGVDYTSFSASTNGFLDFSSSTASGSGTTAYGYQNTQFTATTGTLLALGPLYDDLIFPTGTLQTNMMKYQLDGSAPNRVLTVEWIGVRSFSSSGAGNMNFQVKLYETSNRIEFIYGPMDPGTATFSYTLGLNGPTISAVPAVCELLTQQTANTATFNNTVQNALAVMPEANSRLTFSLLPTSVEPVMGAVPTEFSLSQNYPNPFNPSTTIRYTVPEQSTISLKIYNLLGQEVAILFNGVQDIGTYDAVWNGQSLTGVQVATGVYFYRLEARTAAGKDFATIKKMLLLK